MPKNKLPVNVLVRIAWYGLVFGLPVLFMANCSGWDTGSMAVDSCIIDTQGLRALSNMVWGTIFASVFLLCLPLVAYVGIVAAIVEVPLYFMRKSGKQTQNSK